MTFISCNQNGENEIHDKVVETTEASDNKLDSLVIDSSKLTPKINPEPVKLDSQALKQPQDYLLVFDSYNTSQKLDWKRFEDPNNKRQVRADFEKYAIKNNLLEDERNMIDYLSKYISAFVSKYICDENM